MWLKMLQHSVIRIKGVFVPRPHLPKLKNVPEAAVLGAKMILGHSHTPQVKSDTFDSISGKFKGDFDTTFLVMETCIFEPTVIN